MAGRCAAGGLIAGLLILTFGLGLPAEGALLPASETSTRTTRSEAAGSDKRPAHRGRASVGSVAARDAAKQERVSTAGKVIAVTARKFEYHPARITLKRGVPVTLELTSLDRAHGFHAPELGLRTDVPPGKTVRVEVTPKRAGTFAFSCDLFCGAGHEDMTGEIVVVE